MCAEKARVACGTKVGPNVGAFSNAAVNMVDRSNNCVLCTCNSAHASLLVLMRALPQRLFVLLLLLYAATAAPELPTPGTGLARDTWDKVLNAAWLAAKPHVAFCLGENEPGVLKTMLASFPDPLPTEPAEDPVCSNDTELVKHLCGPKSLMEYYKVSRSS